MKLFFAAITAVGLFLSMGASADTNRDFSHMGELSASQKTHNLGFVPQTEKGLANFEFDVVRKKDSKRYVYAKVKYKYDRYVCVDWETRQVWVPASTWCDADGCCTTTPGYYRDDVVCVARDWVPHTKERKLKIRFKRAHKLGTDEQEVFRVRVSQERRRSDDVDISGEVVEGGDYKVKEVTSSFRRRGLTFRGR